jgi:hypothetical protein
MEALGRNQSCLAAQWPPRGREIAVLREFCPFLPAQDRSRCFHLIEFHAESSDLPDRLSDF